MAKFQVTGTVTLRFDIAVVADDEDAAEAVVKQEMPFGQLVEGAGMPTIEVDSVDPIRKKKAAGK